MQRRVAVTGLGVVSACGLNVHDFWASMREGRSGIKPVSNLPPNALRFPNAADIPEFDPEKYFDAKEASYLDRFAQYGAVAAREAIEDSGIEFTPELKTRTAIITGSCLGGKARRGCSHTRTRTSLVPTVPSIPTASDDA